MAGQHGQRLGAGIFRGGHAVDGGGNLGTAAGDKSVDDALLPLLCIGAVDVVVDQADVQRTFDVF